MHKGCSNFTQKTDANGTAFVQGHRKMSCSPTSWSLALFISLVTTCRSVEYDVMRRATHVVWRLLTATSLENLATSYGFLGCFIGEFIPAIASRKTPYVYIKLLKKQCPIKDKNLASPPMAHPLADQPHPLVRDATCTCWNHQHQRE